MWRLFEARMGARSNLHVSVPLLAGEVSRDGRFGTNGEELGLPVVAGLQHPIGRDISASFCMREVVSRCESGIFALR